MTILLNQVGNKMMVIDGQQRTTSSMLFLASIRHKDDDDCAGCGGDNDGWDDDGGGVAHSFIATFLCYLGLEEQCTSVVTSGDGNEDNGGNDVNCQPQGQR